jgi:hypothetical protein
VVFVSILPVPLKVGNYRTITSALDNKYSWCFLFALTVKMLFNIKAIHLHEMSYNIVCHLYVWEHCCL